MRKIGEKQISDIPVEEQKMTPQEVVISAYLIDYLNDDDIVDDSKIDDDIDSIDEK